jgi:hypothetical protein
MASISENIVREYFESHGFFVRQQRKYIAPARQEDDEIDFLVLHPRHAAATELPFILRSEDLTGVATAVVVVKGWHSETFSPGLLANAPEIFRFLEPAVFQAAWKSFGRETAPAKILVVPALPTGNEARQQSIALLRNKGVDAVLPFRTMLADLIGHIEVNRNYQKSDLLQVIRILKNYELLGDAQLDLFRSTPKRRRSGRRKAG